MQIHYGDNMICTFFGHKDTPDAIEPILQKVLIDLIERKNVNLFYVGNNGNFDSIVKKNLQILQKKYTGIRYYVVLAYLSKKNKMI